jgi:hypothetical protein
MMKVSIEFDALRVQAQRSRIAVQDAINLFQWQRPIPLLGLKVMSNRAVIGIRHVGISESRGNPELSALEMRRVIS